MSTRTHPANGVVQGTSAPGEHYVRAYGNFDGWAFRLYIEDAYRMIERDTGQPPVGTLTLRDGVIEVTFQ